MVRHAAAAMLSISLLACGSAPPSPPAASTGSAPAPSRGGDPARGERLFAELGCKGCHGGKGEGGGIGPDLFAIAWSDAERAEARAVILKGRADRSPPMPAYDGQLDEAQLADLLAWVSGG